MLSILLVQPLGLHLTSYEEVSYRQKKVEITSDNGVFETEHRRHKDKVSWGEGLSVPTLEEPCVIAAVALHYGLLVDPVMLTRTTRKECFHRGSSGRISN